MLGLWGVSTSGVSTFLPVLLPASGDTHDGGEGYARAYEYWRRLQERARQRREEPPELVEAVEALAIAEDDGVRVGKRAARAIEQYRSGHSMDWGALVANAQALEAIMSAYLRLVDESETDDLLLVQ